MAGTSCHLSGFTLSHPVSSLYTPCGDLLYSLGPILIIPKFGLPSCGFPLEFTPTQHMIIAVGSTPTLISPAGATGVFFSSCFSPTLRYLLTTSSQIYPPMFLESLPILHTSKINLRQVSSSAAGHCHPSKLHQVLVSMEANQYGRSNHEHPGHLVMEFPADWHTCAYKISLMTVITKTTVKWYNSSTKDFNMHDLRPHIIPYRRGNWLWDRYVTGQATQG